MLPSRNTKQFVGLIFAAGGISLMPSLAFAGVLTIRTAPVISDGQLRIAPDDYGSWASTGFGGGGDLFNPIGPHGALETAFTSGFFLVVSGTQRELLSDNIMWQGIGVSDGSMARMVTSPLVASDANNDGVADTLNSSFRVANPPAFSTDLHFDLEQRVRTFAPGVAYMQQDYTITNVTANAISFDMVRAFDGDLFWVGGISDDEVGTTMHGAGLGPYVFEQEAALTGITAITLSGLAGGDYYGGKNGVTPGLGLPAYGAGTDTQVWDAYGVPTSWRNHIAGVGYTTNGVSGPFPAGSINPEDAAIGLDFHIDLGPSESTTIRVLHTFGANSPVDLCPWDCQPTSNGFVDIPDMFTLFGHWFAAGPCDFDGNGLGDINDLFAMFGQWGICP